jgi:pullulanase
MTTTEAVQKHLKFFDLKEDNLIGYSISERANGDKWEEILVYFNGNTKKIMIDIPTHNWKIICQNGKIDKEGLGTFSGGKMNILKHSALILVR